MKTGAQKISIFRYVAALTAVVFVFPLQVLQAQIPDGYYSAADGKSGYELKTALHNIIKNHTQRTYAQLWTDFKTTDKLANGKVWDMYSDYEFIFGTNQCGNYSKEGDCYNREHSFPKSWFNDGYPMYTDLFHLYPTDGYVNSRRSNHPFGEVANPTYTSENGSKLGPNSTAGFSRVVFEPKDEYKGDFARTYFYMATCYEDKIASWGQCQTEGVCNGTQDQAFTDWTVALLLKWHKQDPVSEKETERNNAVYGIQRNRNPFIDHPEFVEMIWGGNTDRYEDNSTTGGEDPNPNPGPGETYTDLIISEYVKGSGYNKAIELYNGTGATVNLSQYTLARQASATGAFSSKYKLTGTLESGKTYVIVYVSTGTTAADANLRALADIESNSAAMNFTGRDSIGLFKGDAMVMVDALGTFANSTWGVNKTLRRVCGKGPNPVFTPSEWTEVPKDTISDVGKYDCSGAARQDPELIVERETIEMVYSKGHPGSEAVRVNGHRLTQNVSVSCTGSDFSVSPSSLDFVDVNQDAGSTFTVTYNGNAISATSTVTLASGAVVKEVPVRVTQDPDDDPDDEDPDPNDPEPGEEVEVSPYYQSALGKARYELKTALFNIIKTHDTLKYDDLWKHFERTDRRVDGHIWDFYTNCTFDFETVSHTGAAECGGINREHSFPKSWFGCGAGNEDKDPAATDLHHLYPTDAYFNSRHNNNPYAEVETSTARFISSNGTMDGHSITEGYTGRAFEVLDEYKGDIARTYFYMMTAYEDRTASWGNTCPVCNGTSTQGFSDWYKNMLLKWHQMDPVSEKERRRNDSVFAIQHNRNPYIDHPELVDKIWGGDQTAFGQAVDILVPYVYKTAGGEVIRRDTLYVTHPENNKQFDPVEDDEPAVETHFVPETLLNECFEIYTRKSDDATTTITTRIPATMDSVSGIVYEGCNGVRLGRGDTLGALHFKPVPYSGSFKLLINGKGYSAKKLTATVSCKECEVKEKTIYFTQYKGKENTDSTLAVGFYQSVEPILFNTEPGTESVTLTITAAKNKQVYIGKVVMQTLDSIYLDPALYLETTYWDSLTVESPKAGEEWQKRGLEAAVKLTYKANAKMKENKLSLPKIALEGGKSYTLEASLYNNQTLLGTQSVSFRTKKVSEEPAPAPDTVKAPEFRPYAPDSVFADSAVVTIVCATEEARIYYSVDNLVTLQQYTGPVVLYESDEIEAFAVKEGMVRSDTVRALYTVVRTPDPEVRTVATPTLTPDYHDTVYKDSVEVYITCETDYADIWYSLDGTRPYIPYSADQAPVILRETTVFRTMATKTNWENSDVVVAYYEVALTAQPIEPDIPVDTGTVPVDTGHVTPVDTSHVTPVDTATVKVGNPVFSLEPGGTVDSGTLLSISCTPDTAEIYYTLNPAGRPNLRYSAPLALTSDTTHIAALAMVPGKDTSEIVRAVYYLKPRPVDTTPDHHDTIPSGPTDTVRVKAPVFSLESGSIVEQGTAVTLSCETEGAKIYYSRDWESSPSTQFRKPINITDDTTYLSAWAMIAGEDTSEIVYAVYYLKQDTAGPGVGNRDREIRRVDEVAVYPNPSTGSFTVEAPQGSRVEVFNAGGVCVYKQENYSGKAAFRLSTSGVYFVRVTDGRGSVAVKRVILK